MSERGPAIDSEITMATTTTTTTTTTEAGRACADGDTVHRITRLREAYDIYCERSRIKAALFSQLQQKLPISQGSRKKEKLDASKKKILSLCTSRQTIEANLESGNELVVRQTEALSAKKKKVLHDFDTLEEVRLKLVEAIDNMYNSTFNRLNITQQNLTYRRWELAQGVAHIFSLSTIDALRSPPTSPLRGGGGSKHRRNNSYDSLSMPTGETRQRGVSICGLELDSSVIKKNKDTMLDNESGNNAERLAAALGYVAHILQLLSVYFDIPLRYPVRPVNSRSYICDIVPVSLVATSKKNASVKNQTETIKFPLYIDHVGVERERTRFAYAVFLLNKNIEQILNAHGLDAYGVAPHLTLSNLHKFLSYSN